MPKARISDRDFVEIFERLGCYKMAKETGLGIRAIFSRRERLEKKIHRQITGPEHPRSTRSNIEHPSRIHLEVKNGVVLVGSDSHYWPGEPSTGHKAFVKFCKELNPCVVIKNGDVLDGATISRFPPIGWEERPSLIQELETVQERLEEIRSASPKARHIWPLGNHDARLETRLATVAPEFAKIHGIHLKDHFGPAWQPCWSVWINNNVIVKHRFKGGIFAARNNTMWSGKSIITGHLHSLKVEPFSDYNGVRFGVDSGTLADPYGPQFLNYTEDNPKDWRQGFVVLTFYRGELLWPELVFVRNEKEGEVEFRGRVFTV